LNDDREHVVTYQVSLTWREDDLRQRWTCRRPRDIYPTARPGRRWC